MAALALYIWPLVSVVMFAWLGRERGLIWATVIGYLFLPEAFEIRLSGLPDYNKVVAISLGLVLGAILLREKHSFDFSLVPPPRSKLAVEISEIWKETLGIDELPRDKSFQQLGGSMRKANMAVRLMKDKGVPIKVARLLNEGASVEDLIKVTPEEGPARVGNRNFAILLYFLLALLLFAAIRTTMTNADDIISGPVARPGLTGRDIISMVSEPLIAMVPLFLSLRWLRSRSHQEEVLKAIVIAGAFYACLAAFEARMSPQLNVWVYGYFQHSWLQHLRGGFRPIVFLSHGLSVGFFLLTVVLAGLALFQQLKGKNRFIYLGLATLSLLVLLVSRNLGATMLAVVFLPILMFVPQFFQVRVAAFCAALLLAYPAVWQSQILPIDRFMEFVTTISENRAQSLQTRLDNEAELLERALEKPYFGWGAWGRWRIFDDNGRDRTISDGIWIIELGTRGWIGYICFFGIITMPIFFLIRASRIKEKSQVVVGMAIIMSANLIYMIPNSTLTPIAWMLIGTIGGYTRWYLIEVAAEQPEEKASDEAASPYTRFAQIHHR